MVLNGIDRIERYHDLFRGKRIGLITSVSGINRNFESTISILHKEFGLSALFSPEHGVRGDQAAGALVEDYADPYTGVFVYSLYRKNSKRLTEEMLSKVDAVVYDIQDVGTRYYTFISTLLYALEDCAKAGKQLIVLDRVDMLGGSATEGRMLKKGFESFVGAYPMPVRYGLTPGEFAIMANKEKGFGCDLKIAGLSGWNREMLFPETGLPFVMPSLGIPRFETAFLYPGTCLFEGTNVSEGRGTACPFEIIGAPFIDAYALADAMNEKKLPGVYFRPVYFKPAASKHEGLQCAGVQVHLTDIRQVRSFETGLFLMLEIKKLFGESFCYLPPYKEGGHPFIDLLSGREFSGKNESADDIAEEAAEESKEFSCFKEQYHLYGG